MHQHDSRAADLLDAAQRVADGVLAPVAEEVDAAHRVPAASMDALRDAGLYAVSAQPAVLREVWRILAGACGATSFLWVQHHMPARLAALSTNGALGADWAQALGSGRARAGVMFAHLRRPGIPVLRATEHPGGWCIDGVAPWASGWGLVDVFGVAAETADGRLVWFLLPAERCAEMDHTESDLAVMGATRTVSVMFSALTVPYGHVLQVQPRAQWEAADRVNTLQPPWAALGMAQGTGQLGHEVAATLARARELNDAAMGGAPDPAALLALRADALLLGVRAAAAGVAAAGGASMLRSHPAQRRVREAAFYLVQQQTAAIRAATLDALSAPDRHG